MPAKSKAQQKAAGAALAAKRGESSKRLKGASKDMKKSMTEQEVRELAKTPRKRLPARKSPKR